MLKVKGNLKIGYAMVPNKKLGDGMLVSQTENIEFVLPPVNPEDLKEGCFVLRKARVKKSEINLLHLQIDREVVLENMEIVAILNEPEEKKEEVDWKELKIPINDSPLTPYGEKCMFKTINTLVDLVENLVKERE
jgi:hypothetical protein